MKKTTYLILVALITLSGASCLKEEAVLLFSGTHTVTITARIDPGTKAVLSEDEMTFRWKEGDSISVSITNGTEYALVVFRTEGNGSSAVFSGDVPEGFDLAGKAFYPVDPAHSYDGETAKFNIRQEYDLTDGSCPIPLLGEKNDKGDYLFKACGGAMKFNFLLPPETIDKVIFSSAITTNGLFPIHNGSMSQGAVEFTPEQIADGYRLNRGDITYRQQITVKVSRDAAGNVSAYIPLPPHANYGYKRVIVKATDGSTLFSKDFSYETEIRRGRVSVMPSYRFPQDTDVDFSDFKSLSAQPAASGEDADYVRGSRNVKIYSDLNYIYGYLEVKLSTLGADNLSFLDNLNIWLGTDGQGGGDKMNNPASYNFLLRGRVSENGRVRDWAPELRNLAAGNGFGTVSVDSAPGCSGTGQVVSGILKYRFTINREALGLKNAAKTRLGISFDAGAWTENMVIPSRAGYDISFPVKKDFSHWDDISAATVTGNTQYNGGKNIATKFDFDDNYLYGYLEIDRSDALASNNFKYFNVWVDNNGVNERNKGGWLLVDYMGFEYIVRGIAGENGAPVDWNDIKLRQPTSTDSFGDKLREGLSADEAFGEGEIDPETGLFRWQFRVSRDMLGIDRASLVSNRVVAPRIGVSFDAGGYAAVDKSGMVPDRGGFSVKMLEPEEVPDLEDIYNFAAWDDVEALPLNKNNEGGSDTSNPNAGTWCNFTTLKMKVEGETLSVYMELPADKTKDYIQIFIDGDGVASDQYGSGVWMIHAGTGCETLIAGKHNGLDSQTWTPDLYKWTGSWGKQSSPEISGNGWLDTAKNEFRYQMSFTREQAGISADSIWINMQMYSSATGMGNTVTASRRGYNVNYTTGEITQ